MTTTTEPIFGGLCNDTTAHILSFIPQPKQCVITASFPAIRDRFQLIDHKTFWECDSIDEENKKLVEVIKTHLPPISHHAMNRFVRLLSVTSQFKTMSTCAQFVLDINSFWYYLQDGIINSSLVYFISHFNTIQRVLLKGVPHKEHTVMDSAWNYLLLRCMPKLKTVVEQYRCIPCGISENGQITRGIRQEIEQYFSAKPFSLVSMQEKPEQEVSVYQKIHNIVWTGKSCMISKARILNSKLLTDFHIGCDAICQDIEEILALQEWCVTPQDRIARILQLVNHCGRFCMSRKVWRMLIHRPMYRVVYDAIVERIQNGDTIHSMTRGEKLFKTTEYEWVATGEGLFEVVIALAKDGFSFHRKMIPADISPTMYYEMIHHNIFPHYSFELSVLDLHDCCSPLHDPIVEAVEKYTSTQIDTLSFVKRLSKWDEYIIFDTLEEIRERKCDHLITQALQNHWEKWRPIVEKLFDNQRADLLSWMIGLSENRVRLCVEELVSNACEPNFLFNHWLATNGFPIVQEEIAPKSTPKRERSCPGLDCSCYDRTCDIQPPPKKQKIESIDNTIESGDEEIDDDGIAFTIPELVDDE
jgi:hypothetical protein